MIFPINPRHLEALKALTLSVAGIKHFTPMDCRVISFSIMEHTKLAVSETTIKRVYGFALSRFNPSFYVLNALAIYCGFESWEVFSKSQPDQTMPEVSVKPDVTINPSNDPMLLALLENPIPTLILKSNAPDFTVVTFNKAYEIEIPVALKDLDNSFWKVFDPKNAGGFGPTLLIEAFREAIYTQKVTHMEPLHYNVLSVETKKVELSWWDFKIIPVAYNGIVKYLILNIYNINDKILHQDAIDQAIMRELTMTEDLASTNVQLNIANEKLAQSNKELSTIRNQLEELNNNLEHRVFERTKKLFESEEKQRKLIDNAPVAIAVIRGPAHVVEIANQKIVQYWGKQTHEVMKKPLAIGLPELKGQPFIGILDKVRESGVQYINPELCAMVNFNGILQPRYYDMIYQPVQYVQGVTDSIYIIAVDITEHVRARKNLQISESLLRMAVEAASIGTWSFNQEERKISYNPMFSKILGWESDWPMTYDQAVSTICEEDRERVVKVIQETIANGGVYDITYTQKRFKDGQIVWLRSTGKNTIDDAGNKIFAGVLREIAPGDVH